MVRTFKQLLALSAFILNCVFFPQMIAMESAIESGEKQPTIVVDYWENNTPYLLEFLKGKFAYKGIETLKTLESGKKAKVNLPIPLRDPREEWAWSTNERIGHIDITPAWQPSRDTDPYLKLFITYTPFNKKVVAIFQLVNPHGNSHDVMPPEELLLDKADRVIFISGIVEGNQLEKSKMRMSLVPHGQSLKEISLGKIAGLIKNNRITLENVLQMLPTDLHDELMEYLP